MIPTEFVKEIEGKTISQYFIDDQYMAIHFTDNTFAIIAARPTWGGEEATLDFNYDMPSCRWVKKRLGLMSDKDFKKEGEKLEREEKKRLEKHQRQTYEKLKKIYGDK